MISYFINNYKRLIQHAETQHYRYLYQHFRLKNRLIGLVGARGVGKTTLLLQFIKNKLAIDDTIYVSLDHIHFTQNDLLGFVQELYEDYGTRYFFLDEAHKYPSWNQELKNLYDMYPGYYDCFFG